LKLLSWGKQALEEVGISIYTGTVMKEDCIFCKIAKGEVPSKKVMETVNVLAFNDIDPSADVHILIIPKKHITTFLELKKKHMAILSQMLRAAQRLIKDKNIADKYKLVINGGEYQFVPHFHLHLLGGEMKRQV
jgi:histidine triad (HIT) family protein